MINNICTKGATRTPRTRTTLPTVMTRRQHGCMPSPETHLRIGRSHITPTGHHVDINSRSTHIPLSTRAASEHARPHVPPNLALILAWTYGAVARALGLLVKSNPTVSITFRRQFLSPRDRFQYIPTRERTNGVTPCHNAHMA